MMLRKRVTTILYGSDRNIWAGGSVQLDITDLFASGGPRRVHQGAVQHSTVELNLDLPFDAGQVYGLRFSVPRHRPAWHLIRREDFIRSGQAIERDDVILRLMLVPDAPGLSDLSGGFVRLRQLGSPFVWPGDGIDEAAFDALPDAAKMVLLNIEAKLRETMLEGRPVLSFVRGVSGVAVDRVFLLVDATMKPLVSRSREFASARGHAAPKAFPDLPAHPDSWKHTQFAAGNLQFSCSAAAMPHGTAATLVHSVDVDIDLGRGLAHAGEWLENNVFKPGHKTSQIVIYALLYEQNVLPTYVLDPVSETTRAATRLVAPREMRKPSRRRPASRATTTKKRRGRRRQVGQG